MSRSDADGVAHDTHQLATGLSTVAGGIGWLRRALPTGRALPDDIWCRRHAGILVLLWAHVALIVIFGLLRGETLAHSSMEAGTVAAFTLAAGWSRGARSLRAVMASFGLLSASAILVHLSGGIIEMHFHFFVMLGVIALYQDWVPYLLAVGFVAVHHGTLGVVNPEGVYNHPAALAHPWVWAAIHAGFVLAASVVSMVAWRLNERYRAQADRARQQEVIARLSRQVLSSPDFDILAEEAVRLSAETLELEYASVLELRPELGAFVLRAGSGWGRELRGTSLVRVGPDTYAGAALLADQTVVVEEGRSDAHDDGSRRLHASGVVVGATAVIPGPDGPFGVLSVHSTRGRSFDAHDVSFLEALANIMGGALLRRRSDEQLMHQALHDSLTGLPNRVLFHDRLTHALARRSNAATTVALLDLDNFKAVNDSLGHGVGDELLVAVAGRLRTAIRPSDTIARLGGDEFAVLFEQTAEPNALRVALRIRDALREPLIVEGRPVLAQASIGIASNTAAQDGAELVRNADLAMYAAKRGGKAGIEIFHEGMHDAVLARLEMEGDLRVALENALAGGEFHLLYQPKVSLETNRIIGVEALVRWQHPERGIVAPLEFIPLAEETGLIVPIGTWVLEEACRQSARWRASSPDGAPLVMSVNVSALQFEHGLADTVQRALAATGIDPATLCLELTESILMDNVETAVTTLAAVKELGVKISIDDFGTGYSSLNYLKQFPLDELKIDKSFVDGLGEDDEDRAIVAAIMGMAHALNLSVVAEGVETPEQVAKLQELVRASTSSGPSQPTTWGN